MIDLLTELQMFDAITAEAKDKEAYWQGLFRNYNKLLIGFITIVGIDGNLYAIQLQEITTVRRRGAYVYQRAEQ